MLKDIDALTLKRVIGGLTLLALIFKIASDRLGCAEIPAPENGTAISLALASGFGSTLANVGAPPFTAYLLLQPQDDAAALHRYDNALLRRYELDQAARIHVLIGLFDVERLLSIAWVFVLIPPAVDGRAIPY